MDIDHGPIVNIQLSILVKLIYLFIHDILYITILYNYFLKIT